MLQKTWPFGTRLNATVEEKRVHAKYGAIIILTDERGEGHILADVDNVCVPSIGESVIMEFTNGGPTGGYWRIVGKQQVQP